MWRVHGGSGDSIHQIVLHIHQAGLVVHIDPVTAVTVGVHDTGVGDVVDLVIQNLVARQRCGPVAVFHADGTAVVHDALKQVVNVIERDGVVGVANAARLRHIASAHGNGNGAVIAVVDLVVRVEVVVSNTLADSERRRDGAPVAFDDVVPHRHRVRDVGVRVGRHEGIPDAHSQ